MKYSHHQTKYIGKYVGLRTYQHPGIYYVKYTASRDAPMGRQKRPQVTQNLSDKHRESEPVSWLRVKHREGTGDCAQLK
jgi:hypothetical protein